MSTFKPDKEHPLAGVVLCFTSITPEQRTELAMIAGQMGAAHKFDLTSDVTHLLVGEVNTPKYKFVARERTDVTVLKPEWIHAVRDSWMQGGDTDIKELEEEYRCPTFMGLSICITGFEDLTFRNHVQETATAHGAEFRKDLTKSVTHLIARSTEGQKYKFATQWNIKVVTIKWFSESIERGMVLEETLYHPLLAAEQQGEGAWNRSAAAAKPKQPSNDDTANPRPRKLRRIASTKLVDQNEGIWGDIVRQGLDPPAPANQQVALRKPDDTGPARVIPVLQEAKSFASETTLADAVDSRPQPAGLADTGTSNGLLHDCYFFIFGFSEKQLKVLRHHLQSNGAQLVSSINDFARPVIPKTGYGLYMIVPYRTRRKDIPSTDHLAFECEIVTDMWLERCLDAKLLVPVESHVSCSPLPQFPITDFQGMRICSTGFSGIDLLHLSKLVDLIGAVYDEYLTPKASVMICKDPMSASAEKLRHIFGWGIPAVSAEWLWTSIQIGRKEPFTPWLVPNSHSRSADPSQKHSTIPTQPSSHMERLKSNAAGQSGNNLIPRSQQLNVDTQSQEGSNGLASSCRGGTQDVTRADGPTNDPARPASNSRNGSESLTKRQVQHGSACESAKQPPGPSALDLAVSGLLKQARAANSRAQSDVHDEHDHLRVRRRKPLLGRAQTISSTRTNDPPSLSRASSIDTLNEDGCGSAVESDRNPLSRTNSRNGHSFTSLLNGGRHEYEENRLLRREGIDPEEDDTPAMTQLNYEDPDAIAMRARILKQAGKSPDQDMAKKQGLFVGEVRELEDVGWGTGRRTRKATKTALDDF